MEKTGTIHIDLEDTTKLTWIEYKLEQFVELIKERLPKIVQPKETVSDWDKAAWFTSIVVLLGKILPANRFLFRIIEEENQFLIQLHDPAQLQQPQTIEVPYRKVFDWKIGSWKEAKAIRTKEERQQLFNYWIENGIPVTEIAKHFGLEDSSRLNKWVAYSSREFCYTNRENRGFANQIRNTIKVLLNAGIEQVSQAFMSKVFNCSSSYVYGVAKYNTKYCVDPSNADIDCAIKYVKAVMAECETYKKRISEKIPRRNDHTHALICLSTGVDLRNDNIWSPEQYRMVTYLDEKGYNEAIRCLETVLNNLNQMKGEGK